MQTMICKTKSCKENANDTYDITKGVDSGGNSW